MRSTLAFLTCIFALAPPFRVLCNSVTISAHDNGDGGGTVTTGLNLAQPVTCPSTHFRCDDGVTCIKQKYKCDDPTSPDCPDGSDESPHHCSKCLPTEFQCGDGSCIKLKYACDGGEPDCQDGTDETGDACRKTESITLSSAPQTITTSTASPTVPPPATSHPRRPPFEFPAPAGPPKLLTAQTPSPTSTPMPPTSTMPPQNLNADSVPVENPAETTTAQQRMAISNAGSNVSSLNSLSGKNGTQNKEIDLVIRLLEDGNRLMTAQDERLVATLGDRSLSSPQAVIVIGMTGSGKSTLTHLLAGNLSRLLAIETGQKSQVFLYQAKAIGSGIKSKTVYPELTIDPETNDTYYDCPGFDDTRSVSNDIAGIFFTRQVLENRAAAVKILITVAHNAVQQGKERSRFMDLIYHVTTLMNGVEKYSAGLALIVTKVERHVADYQQKLTSKQSDDRVKEGVARFLNETLFSVSTDLQNMETPKKKGQLQQAEKLIGLFLEKDKLGNYHRIGLLRQPEEAGIVGEIPLLNEMRESLVGVVRKNLNFVNKSKNEFSYTLSSKSRLSVRDLGEALENQTMRDMKSFTGSIQSHYRQEMERVNASDFVLGGDLKRAYNLLFRVKEELAKTTTRQDFATVLDTFWQGLDLAPLSILSNPAPQIRDRGDYIDFLNAFVDRYINADPIIWIKPFQPLLKFLHQTLVTLAGRIDDHMTTLMTSLRVSLQACFDEDILQTKSRTNESIANALAASKSVMKMLGHQATAQSIQIFASHTLDGVVEFCPRMSESALLPMLPRKMNRTIEIYRFVPSIYFTMDNNEEGTTTKLHPLNWIQPFQNLATYISQTLERLKDKAEREELAAEVKVLNEALKKQQEQVKKINETVKINQRNSTDEIVNMLNHGEVCEFRCKHVHGGVRHNHFWCNTLYKGESKGRQVCSHVPRHDIYGYKCTSTCDYHGSDYKWCKVKDGWRTWGRCSNFELRTVIFENGVQTIHFMKLDELPSNMEELKCGQGSCVLPVDENTGN